MHWVTALPRKSWKSCESQSKCLIMKQSCLELVGRLLAFSVQETLDKLSRNQGIVLFISGYTSLLVGLGYKWSLNGNTAINSSFEKLTITTHCLIWVWVSQALIQFRGCFSLAAALPSSASIRWDVALLRYECQLALFMFVHEFVHVCHLLSLLLKG